MREYVWSEWQARRRAGAGAAAALAERSTRFHVHGKRSAEEREMIVRGVVALMRLRERERRLVRVGPRTYELRPPTSRG